MKYPMTSHDKTDIMARVKKKQCRQTQPLPIFVYYFPM